MKDFIVKRNIWIFSGLCFFLSAVLSVYDDKTFALRAFFMVIACIVSFINVYKTHKKIDMK
ncbi:MAG: hypothetical protein K0S61_3124 [Anaerocolumna sp.]|jgi:hypothetical protein|nr:hypothetical protein [Anaerocolumna sp.]